MLLKRTEYPGPMPWLSQRLSVLAGATPPTTASILQASAVSRQQSTAAMARGIRHLVSRWSSRARQGQELLDSTDWTLRFALRSSWRLML